MVIFLPTLLKRDAYSVNGVYASFPFRTASGHIKLSGSDPPVNAGKKLDRKYTVIMGFFCTY